MLRRILFVLAFGVMIFAGGAGNWNELANVNDPLPLNNFAE